MEISVLNKSLPVCNGTNFKDAVGGCLCAFAVPVVMDDAKERDE
jgi:hypothetical protein